VDLFFFDLVFVDQLARCFFFAAGSVDLPILFVWEGAPVGFSVQDFFFWRAPNLKKSPWRFVSLKLYSGVFSCPFLFFLASAFFSLPSCNFLGCFFSVWQGPLLVVSS